MKKKKVKIKKSTDFKENKENKDKKESKENKDNKDNKENKESKPLSLSQILDSSKPISLKDKIKLFSSEIPNVNSEKQNSILRGRKQTEIKSNNEKKNPNKLRRSTAITFKGQDADDDDNDLNENKKQYNDKKFKFPILEKT